MGTTARRLAAVAVAGSALVATTVAPVGAQSQPAVGTTWGSTSLLGIRIGDGATAPLDLRLVGEDGATVLDPASAVPESLARIAPVLASSSLLPGLDALEELVPASEVRSSGDEVTTSGTALDLGTLLAEVGAPAGLLAGSVVPAELLAALDATGSRTAATSAIAGLTTLAGLVRVDSLFMGQNALAAPGSSSAERGAGLANLDVLTLDGVLGLVGLTLEDLPLDVVTGLLDTLGLSLGDLDADAVNGLVDGLQAQIADLQDDLAPLLAIVDAAVCQGTEPILALLGIDCLDVTGTVAALTAQVDALVDQLRDLLTGVLDTLTDLPLLSLSGIALDVVARAEETAADSAAGVAATIGDLQVLGQDLPGLDTGATLAQVDALAAQVTSLLNGLLGTISPALADLLTVDLLQQVTDVAETATGTAAAAAVTGLSVVVNPPDVCALVAGLVGDDSVGALLGDAATGLLAPVGDVLAGLGVAVPCLGADAGAAALVDGSAIALSEPLTIEALSVSEVAELRLPATPAAPATPTTPGAPATPLARTGTAVPLGVAGVLLVAALVARRRLTTA